MNTVDLAWLQHARDAANTDPAFRGLGTCDTRMGIKVGDAAYLVDFVAFECGSVEEIELDALRDADFYLDMTLADWRAYLDGRKNGVGPSLCSLDVDRPDNLVKARDPLCRLSFERYHLTLQAFFDAGARRAA